MEFVNTGCRLRRLVSVILLRPGARRIPDTRRKNLPTAKGIANGKHLVPRPMRTQFSKNATKGAACYRSVSVNCSQVGANKNFRWEIKGKE